MEGLQIRSATVRRAAAANVLRVALAAGHTHGIGYWAGVTNVRRRGDQIESFDIVENEPQPGKQARQIRVTVAEIGPAVERMLQDPKGCGCRGVMKQLLVDDEVDGPLADVIIQVACFGKVIYG